MKKIDYMKPDELSQERLAEIGLNAMNTFLDHTSPRRDAPVTPVERCNAMGLSYEEAVVLGYVKPEPLIYEYSGFGESKSGLETKFFWTPSREKAYKLFINGLFPGGHEHPSTLTLHYYSNSGRPHKLASYHIGQNEAWEKAHTTGHIQPWPRADLPRIVRSELGKIESFEYRFTAGMVHTSLETSFYVAPKERTKDEKCTGLYYYPNLKQAVDAFQEFSSLRGTEGFEDLGAFELGLVFTQSGNTAKDDIHLIRPIFSDSEERAGLLIFNTEPVSYGCQQIFADTALTSMNRLSAVYEDLDKFMPDVFDQDLMMDQWRVQFVKPGETFGPDTMFRSQNNSQGPLIAFYRVFDGGSWSQFIDTRPLDFVRTACRTKYIPFTLAPAEPSGFPFEHKHFSLMDAWLNHQVNQLERDKAALSFEERIADAASRSGNAKGSSVRSKTSDKIK